MTEEQLPEQETPQRSYWAFGLVLLLPILATFVHNLWVLHEQRMERDFNYRYRVQYVYRAWTRWARRYASWAVRRTVRRIRL